MEPVAPNADHYKSVMGIAIQRAIGCVSNANWDHLDDGDDDYSKPPPPVNLYKQGECKPGEKEGLRLVGRLRGNLDYWRNKLLETELPALFEHHESYKCLEENSVIQVFSGSLPLVGRQYDVFGLYQVYDVPSEETFRVVFATDANVATLHRQHQRCDLLEGTLAAWFSAAPDRPDCCDLWLVAWPDLKLTALAAFWQFGTLGCAAKTVGNALRAALLKRQPNGRT